MLMSTANFLIVLVVELVMCLILTINDGTLSSYLSETFPTQVRYSGFALSFNVANALFGGTASFICTSLITATGSTLAPAFYMVAACVAMIMSHEHSNEDLSESLGVLSGRLRTPPTAIAWSIAGKLLERFLAGNRVYAGAFILRRFFALGHVAER